MPRFRNCYELALARDPSLAGKVTTAIVIGPDGGVAEARVAESTLTDAELHTCLNGVSLALRFAPPKGGGKVFVTYPFVFSSSGGSPEPRRGGCIFP
jgi:outer membrane biosynthesis protein TonB